MFTWFSKTIFGKQNDQSSKGSEEMKKTKNSLKWIMMEGTPWLCDKIRKPLLSHMSGILFINKLSCSAKLSSHATGWARQQEKSLQTSVQAARTEQRIQYDNSLMHNTNIEGNLSECCNFSPIDIWDIKTDISCRRPIGPIFNGIGDSTMLNWLDNIPQ